MADFPFAIVGFDLDGTLIDTSGDLTAAVNHALTAADRPLLSAEEVEPMVGLGAKHMLEQALMASGGCDPDAFRPLYRLMLGYYEANVSRFSTPYPGMVEAVEDLRGRGVRCGVVTNKFEALARKLLGELGLIDRFETVIGGDTLGRGNAKPSPAPILALQEQLGGGRTVFIGDSTYDIEAARAAGVASVAVRFGFLLQPVEELGADAVLDRYPALIPTLEGLTTR